jgi:hypothetical protein
MLKTVKFRILFAILLFTFLVICIDTLLTPPVDNTSINIVNLHLKEVSGNKPSRGSLNYDLYVTENYEHYKIGADQADCFAYDAFIDNVKPGQLITVGVRKDNGFFKASDLKLVVLLMANGQTYLRSQCVNKSLSNDKKNIPIFGILGLAFIYFIFSHQESKDLEKKRKRKQQTDEIN